MKNYLGARSVKTNAVYCRQCLIDRGVLYRYGTEISPAEARKNNLQCVSCGADLASQTVAKGKKERVGNKLIRRV